MTHHHRTFFFQIADTPVRIHVDTEKWRIHKIFAHPGTPNERPMVNVDERTQKSLLAKAELMS
jgi:hypothetical protein